MITIHITRFVSSIIPQLCIVAFISLHINRNAFLFVVFNVPDTIRDGHTFIHLHRCHINNHISIIYSCCQFIPRCWMYGLLLYQLNPPAKHDVLLSSTSAIGTCQLNITSPLCIVVCFVIQSIYNSQVTYPTNGDIIQY